ncbi:restriction endonuclease subunit S [Bacteroides eggerthii]|jgi:type I restriction enzyme S subunit|uniref:restriction endonuclease subunit S n=1 Tax=Bacteroides eggerthii TaxID=28111 RepID=UPI000E514B72|nr:restriction endonuclease subunit S [Bacteroides eggerthii]RGU01401.1 restriction endonuclease subunit S [Bacteroides eggerthii]
MTNNNDKKVLNVPLLRFPEFTEEWKEHCLAEYLDFKNGLNPSANKFGSGIKFISVMDILNNNFITYDCIRTSVKITPEEQVAFAVEKGDMLFQRSSETLEDVGRANVYMDENPAVFGGFVIRGKKKTEYNPMFFRYLLASPYARKKIIPMGAGAQHFNIGQDGLSKVKLHFPILQEQQKIAALLRLIDERITTQNKIIEKYESLIKGINCKIFALIQGNEYRLGDIATITNGNSNVQDASVEYRVGLYPFFDRSEDVKYLPTFLFDKESIIYPGEGTEFMPRYYNGKFALHQRCYAICDFNEAVNPQFLYFFLKTQNSYFIRNAVGSTVPSLRLDTFQKLKVVIPSKETQYSVYSFLSTLEQKLDVENSIMKMLLCQKRYLLRQMFI